MSLHQVMSHQPSTAAQVMSHQPSTNPLLLLASPPPPTHRLPDLHSEAARVPHHLGNPCVSPCWGDADGWCPGLLGAN